MNVIGTAIIGTVLIGNAHADPHSHAHNTATRQQATSQPSLIVSKPDQTANTGTPSTKDQLDSSPDPVRGTIRRDWEDYAALAISCAVAGVGAWGVSVAVSTLRFVRRQSIASVKQTRHLIASERPFLTIEIRNETEIWMVNHGKSPADIVFKSHLEPAWPEWSDTEQRYLLSASPFYGFGDRPDMRAINVQWVVPQGDQIVGVFYPHAVWMTVGEPLRRELEGGLRALFVYGKVRYRGLGKGTIYESRFCYRWTPQLGMKMDGSPGYNQYT